MQSHKTQISICALALGLCTACATEKYVEKPIDPQQTYHKILDKSPLSSDFLAFCQSQNYQSSLPFSAWGIEELTLSALYHHTKLDVAKARLGVAKASIEAAGLKPAPLLGGSVARSNRANGDIRPFAYGLNVEIPIETANKSAIRVEEAQQLAEATRLDVAETAWHLRSQLMQDWLNYHAQQLETAHLQTTATQYETLVRMMRKRVDIGLAGNADLAPILAQQAKLQSQLAQSTSKQEVLIAAMAADAGLSVEKFKLVKIPAINLEENVREISKLVSNPQQSTQVQSDALLNRIDIRRSLAKYAAAESKIKLEVAKQTPDITLTPGFAFEFGDKIWSLGFASLLNLLTNSQSNQQVALIREAEQLRAVEGAQFEALQAKVIAETEQASAELSATQQQLNHATMQKNKQLLALEKIQKQFDAGLLDALDLMHARILYNQHAQDALTAQVALLRAANRLQDVMQRDITQPVAMTKIITETTTP